MLLVEPKAVIELMGLHDDLGVTQNVKSALGLASTFLATLLESRLGETACVDYFTLPKYASSNSPVQFRLSGRYIDGDVEIRYATDGLPLVDENAGELLSIHRFMLDSDTGVVTIPVPPVTGVLSYSISYAYGFSSPQDVPQHVRDMAISAAVFVLNTYPSSTGNRKQNTTNMASRAMFTHLKGMAGTHRRPRLCVTFPSVSVFSE